MEARAASLGGIRGAEARDGAGNQGCCEKVLHLFFLCVGPHCIAAPDNLCRVI
jgi:hypothetical protein